MQLSLFPFIAATPFLSAIILCGPSLACAADPPTFTAELKPVEGGAMRRLRAPLMRPYKMTKEMPAGLTKGIDDPSVMYGLIPTANKGKGMFVAVTESADAQSGNLYLDTNEDGDLSNDPMPTELENKWMRRGPVAFEAERELSGTAGSVLLRFYRYAPDFAKNQTSLQDQGNPLFVHRDDAREGKVELDGFKTTVLLKELAARGRYDNLETEHGEPAVALFIDRNGNGEYDRPFEQYDLSQPFTIAGSTYELDSVSSDGSRLVLRKAKDSVPEVPIPLQSIGQLVPKFKAVLLQGGEFNFPADVKRKIVLLDFWATWCGPCMSRKPELLRVYERMKDKDVEFIGICLDGSEDRELVLKTCDELKMSWPQLYDGQVWSGEVR